MAAHIMAGRLAAITGQPIRTDIMAAAVTMTGVADMIAIVMTGVETTGVETTGVIVIVAGIMILAGLTADARMYRVLFAHLQKLKQ